MAGHLDYLLFCCCSFLLLALLLTGYGLLCRRNQLPPTWRDRLRQSESRLTATLQSIGDAVISTDVSGNVTHLNAAAEMLTGWTFEAAEGLPVRSVFGLLNPLTGEEAPDLVALAVKEGHIVKLLGHTTLVARDGTRRQVANSCAPIRTGTGELLGTVLVFRDVTDEHRNLVQLQESRERFAQIAERSREMIWETDAQGLLTYVSRACRTMLGYRDDEMIAKLHLFDLHPDDDRREFREEILAIFAQKLVLTERYNSLVMKNGRIIDVLTAGVPMLDDAGNLRGYRGSDRDITERKRSEEARALEADRMASLIALNAMADRPLGEIVAAVVEDALRLTRSTIGHLAVLSEDESVLTMQYWSRPAHSVSLSSDRPGVYPVQDTGFWGEAVRQRKPVIANDCAELSPPRHAAPAGRLPVIRHMSIPVFDGNRIVAVAGVGNKNMDYDDRDAFQLQLLMDGWWQIVKHRRMEEELRQTNSDLRAATQRANEMAAQALAASAAKSEFLANMSHEIRTPLNGIVGAVELLGGTVLDGNQARYCQAARDSANGLLDLVDDVLDFSKTETADLRLDTAPFDLPAAVNRVVEGFTIAAARKGIDLTATLAPDLPVRVKTDARRLRQVLTNLLGNAVKFTEHGRITLRGSLVNQTDRQAVVHFEIRDTGIGISREVQGRLFAPFTQADPSTTRKYGGMGLGLAMSKRLVKLLGGEIGMQSEENRGSTFWFTIRLEKINDSEIDRDSSPASPAGRRILAAEDNEVNQLVVRDNLLRLGYRCDVVENGRLAVEAVAREHYDAVIMDCQMPEMDGLNATRAIRAREAELAEREGSSPHIPIVALTASAMKSDQEACIAAGMDAYLAKPLDPPLLATVLARLLGCRGPDVSAASPHHTAATACAPPHSSAATTIAAPEAPVDTPSLLKRCMGKPAMAITLADRFATQLRGTVAQLGKFLDAADAENLTHAAHALKGAAASMSASTVSSRAKRIEELGRQGSLDEARRELDNLANAVRECLEYLPKVKASLEEAAASPPA